MITEIEEQQRAQQILDGFDLPSELSSIGLTLGQDADQEAALHLSFTLKEGIKLDTKTAGRLTKFMTEVTLAILRSGVSLFPYASLDEAA